MDEIMAAPVWSRLSAPASNYLSVFAPAAAMCPSAKRPAFRQALVKLQTDQIMPILQFFDILDSLEKVSLGE